MKQKPKRLLNNSDNKSTNFSTKKWYVIHDQNGADYGEDNETGTSIKFETENIKSSLFDYSDAYILVAGGKTVTNGDENTEVAFKNCAPFTKCITHINDDHIDTAEDIDITMSMYNLIEYSYNYSDTFGNLWQFKRDESLVIDNVTTNNSSQFKYNEIRKIAAGDDYTTGCLLDYQYFKDHYQLTTFDLSKQKELDADRRAIQQIQFYEMLDTKSQVCMILEKAKETILEFYKGTAKVLRILYMVEYSKANVKLSDSQ